MEVRGGLHIEHRPVVVAAGNRKALYAERLVGVKNHRSPHLVGEGILGIIQYDVGIGCRGIDRFRIGICRLAVSVQGKTRRPVVIVVALLGTLFGAQKISRRILVVRRIECLCIDPIKSVCGSRKCGAHVQRHIIFLTFILIFIYLERKKDKYLATGCGINRAYRYS